jgi:general secretion pathway protein K
MMKVFSLNERGSATILMMLIGTVIVTVGLGFNWLVREHIRASEGFKDKAVAILKARSAFDRLIYLLLLGEMTRKEIVLAGLGEITNIKTIPLNGDEIVLADDIRVRIRDTSGMISLFSIDRNILERLIKNTGLVANPSIPVDSFLDWTDKDDLSRLSGAEKGYYERERLPYIPRNYAVQYVEELRFIRGFTPELLAKISPSLTLMPSSGLNPNTADDAVLKAYLDIDDDSLRVLREYLSQKVIWSDTELYSLVGRRIQSEDSLSYVPSFNVDISLSVGQPRSLYKIRAGLNIIQKPLAPYTVYYWIEE